MKRYLLFYALFEDHSGTSELGGWNDMRGRFDSIAEAVQHMNTVSKWDYEWWHVVDLESNIIVAQWFAYLTK